jgi:alkylated DNA repair dioxygenase AlkB
MSQLGLFEAESRVLVDDDTGVIRYHRNVVTPDRADALYAQLRASIPWRSERRMMYEREVDVPRLVASLRIEEHVPDALARIVPLVDRIAGARFTSIGLNLYRDGQDSVAPHNDRLRELIPHAPIALLSLGATRRMTIRGKAPRKRVLDVDLEPGSLLVMSYATQLHYDHGIPKTHEAVGARISLAFRARSTT